MKMNAKDLEKLNGLVELSKRPSTNRTVPDARITLTNLMRLVNGDLSHLGDVIVGGGGCISLRGCFLKALGADSDPSDYTIEKPTVMIGNVECTRGETKPLNDGTVFWTWSINDGVYEGVWDDSDKACYRILRKGFLFLTEAAAADNCAAVISLLTGEQ